MSNSTETPPLCVADDATFWPWHRWPEFARWHNPAETIVILPLVGLADWGLGHPLEAEEIVLMSVLRAASQQRPEGLPILVVPPVRFVLGPDPGSAFAVEPPVAHALVAEIAASIVASGFRRVVLLNASPWNEEFIAAAARDLRIALGLQMFRISLSGLGLDFHPVRSRTRHELQTLITALTGRAPEAAPAGEAAPRVWGDEAVRPLTEPALSVEAAQAAGPAILEAAAKKLVGLLREVHARPPLANGGVIAKAQP